MTPAPIAVSLAEQPAYYALYALYVDYVGNNQYHRAQEYFARLRDVVRYIQPLVGREQPYMKSWSLRLFTERRALERFSPEQAATAWWLARQVVDEIGPPQRWPYAPPSVRSWRRPVRQTPVARATDARATDARATGAQTSGAPDAEAAPPPSPAFPRSPVDYRMAV
jgi:hypothetical protein